MLSLGCNEVPKAFGGTYWTGDTGDARDFRQGYDPNDINKVSIFADLISRLKDDRFLSDELTDLDTSQKVVDKLLQIEGGKRYRNARIMDLIEFGRIIHAEMSAICDAARNGLLSQPRSSWYDKRGAAECGWKKHKGTALRL